MDAGPTIEVENLVKRYGRLVAVNNISFGVNRGEIVGFLGPNGAGKSTTMRILTGYVSANSGVVRICGHAVASAPAEVKRRVGYMPENNPLPEDLRVSDFLHWRAQLKELPRRKRYERVEAVLRLCDLERAQGRIIGKLSKGYRQRVGVADAILAEPEVIIMDEPTIGLDPHQILMIRDLIASLRGRMTVIISSHILPEIEMTCDRVVIINHGHIVASGTPSDLRHEFLDRTAYELEVSGDFAAVCGILDRVEKAARIERVRNSEDADGFYQVLVHLGGERHHGEQLLHALATNPAVRVRTLTRKQASLEQVFLAATRRSWETITPLGRPEEPEPVSNESLVAAKDE